VYETLEFFTGAGFEEEQPIVSVMRLRPKGVMSESMKCRFGLGSDLEAPEELWQTNISRRRVETHWLRAMHIDSAYYP